MEKSYPSKDSSYIQPSSKGGEQTGKTVGGQRVKKQKPTSTDQIKKTDNVGQTVIHSYSGGERPGKHVSEQDALLIQGNQYKAQITQQESLREKHKQVKEIAALKMEFVPGVINGEKAHELTLGRLLEVNMTSLEKAFSTAEGLQSFYKETFSSFLNEIKQTDSYRAVKEEFNDYVITFSDKLQQPGITDSHPKNDSLVTTELSTKYCFPLDKKLFMYFALHEMDHAEHRKKMIYNKRDDDNRDIKDELRVRVNDNYRKENKDYKNFAFFILMSLLVKGEHGHENKQTTKLLMSVGENYGLEGVLKEHDLKPAAIITDPSKCLQMSKDDCSDSELYSSYRGKRNNDFENYRNLNQHKETIHNLIDLKRTMG
ncbi:MAG: hypothetical protein P0S93_03000 [Candidatus Neptunochlamydia sp.]|nr:hypothetical protein [Candidatus Neptunochlamydia sp.]